jgi:proline racemase
VSDVPTGRVTAAVRTEGGRVADVTFVNVASYVHARSVPVPTSRGTVAVDIAFGGAMYAVLPAAAVGLEVRPEALTDLIALGREIRNALNVRGAAEHATDARLSGIYGTIFTQETAPTLIRSDGSRQLHQRNVTIFADGEVDRSPCGSGTSARVALLAAGGELRPGDHLRHESIVGSVFEAWIAGPAEAYGEAAVIPAMTGTAYATGTSRFTVDPDDALVPGFLFR